MPSRQERRKAERDAAKRASAQAGAAGAAGAGGAGGAATARAHVNANPTGPRKRRTPTWGLADIALLATS